MTTQASTLPEATFAATSERQSKTISPIERFSWSVRRELWENRSLYIAPLAAGALLLLGFFFLAFRASVYGDTSHMDAASRSKMMTFPYDISAAVIMGTVVVVSLFYCLDALYGERRDRSILFWKSLPVSDTTTVLAKAAIPILVLPLIGVGTTVLTHSGILLMNVVARATTGGAGPTLWSQVSLSREWMMLLYHMFAVHSLWYAPIYAWLLLASAWAPRTPFLWAVLPPAAIAIFEEIAFHTSYVAQMLARRVNGGMEAMSGPHSGMVVVGPDMQITMGRFLATPGLWLGLLVAALLLAGAVRLRRYREPI